MSIFLFILAGLSAFYGFFVRLAGSGTSFWLVWILIGLFFLGLGLLIATGLWKKIHPVVRGICLGLIGLGLASVIGLSALIFSQFGADGSSQTAGGNKSASGGAEASAESSGSSDECDYIIVLGAQVYRSGPSITLRYRLDRAASYMEEHPDAMCIVTGCQDYDEPKSEAECMKDYLVGIGIDGDRILVEPKAENTVQNMQYSIEMIRERNGDEALAAPVSIVTNDFHMFRALHLAKKQGLKDARGIAAGSVKAFLPNNVLRECMGVVKDVMFGNMDLF